MKDKDIISHLCLEEEHGYSMMLDKYISYVSSIVYQMTKGILSPSDMEELVSDVFFQDVA